MPDFTLKTYQKLLTSLQQAGYTFIPFRDYLNLYSSVTYPSSSGSHAKDQQDPVADNHTQAKSNKHHKHPSSFTSHFSSTEALREGGSHHSPITILRHDVDRLPGNALRTAQMESSLGIRGSYYFRVVPESWDEQIIRDIATLGHEIGYHYEDVTLAAQALKIKDKGRSVSEDPDRVSERRGKKSERQRRSRLSLRTPGTKGILGSGNPEQGTENQELLKSGLILFKKHLAHLRKLVPVDTICMHGSPRSKYDSRDLWQNHDYRDFGITGEPYFDLDFTRLLYLTDTGRRWNGDRVNVRDKVGKQDKRQKKKDKSEGRNLGNGINLNTLYRFRSTFDIIRAVQQDELPDQLMLTIHPQRWTDQPGAWVKELVWQNVKNQVKRVLAWRVIRNT